MRNVPATQKPLTCDVAIIGGGSAGYAAARTASAAGLHTVVIEGGDEIGGLCILRGCMPSKALLYAAEVLHLARAGKRWGLRIPKASFDFPAIMARKKALIGEFARYRRDQLTGGKFSFFRARASFLDPHTVALHDPREAAPKTVRARYFVICTGSVTSASTVPGLEEIGFITSDEALSLRKLPRSLIVLGGGPVAVELAQFFCRLDVKVSLIQRGEHLLRDFDTDAALVVEKVLQREGIRLWSGTTLLGADNKAAVAAMPSHVLPYLIWTRFSRSAKFPTPTAFTAWPSIPSRATVSAAAAPWSCSIPKPSPPLKRSLCKAVRTAFSSSRPHSAFTF